MPNHVVNIVKMEGITKLPLFKMEYDEYKKEDVMRFDFNKLIPMPETLDMVSGSIETLAIEAVVRKLNKRRYGFQQGYVESKMSDDEYDKRVKSHGKTEEELLDLGLQYIANKVKYGATTWYDWCVENWGTKWNAYENEQIDEDTIKFETAWSSPEPVIAKLAKMYPDAVIEHWWAYEDMGSNTGYKRFYHGQETESCYYDTCSNEAYDTYITCWGETECLHKDEDGNWQRHSCENCHGCD